MLMNPARANRRPTMSFGSRCEADDAAVSHKSNPSRVKKARRRLTSERRRTANEGTPQLSERLRGARVKLARSPGSRVKRARGLVRPPARGTPGADAERFATRGSADRLSNQYLADRPSQTAHSHAPPLLLSCVFFSFSAFISSASHLRSPIENHFFEEEEEVMRFDFKATTGLLLARAGKQSALIRSISSFYNCESMLIIGAC